MVSKNKNLQIVVTAIIATLFTYFLSINLGLGAVVASGLVGIIASLLLPAELAVIAYTATFVGMSSPLVLVSYPMVIVAGLLVGGIFILTQPIYQGFGGKLGTIAACAVIITVKLFSLI